MPNPETSNDDGGSPLPTPAVVEDTATLLRKVKETLSVSDYGTGDKVGGDNSKSSSGTGKGSPDAVNLVDQDEINGQKDHTGLVWKIVKAVEVNPAETPEELADKITNSVSFAKAGCGLEASCGPLVGPTHMTLQEMLELDQQGCGVDARDMLQTYLEEMKESQAMCSTASTSKTADLQQYFYMVSKSIALSSRSGTSTRQGKMRRREKYHRQQHAVLQERRNRDSQSRLRNLSPNTARERKERRERLEEERYLRLSQVEVKARRNRKQGWVTGASFATSLAALVTEQSLASRDTMQARNELTASRGQARQ